MEEFKDQLINSVPLATNCIIKLENQLKKVDDEITLRKQQIKSRRDRLNENKAKEFISSNLLKYQNELSNKTSSTLIEIGEIDSEFRKFENDNFDFKRSNYMEIEKQIQDHLKTNDSATNCLETILEKINDEFVSFREVRDRKLTKKLEYDRNIDVINKELEEKRIQRQKLEQKLADLDESVNEKKKILDLADDNLEEKQQMLDDLNSKNKQLKSTLDEQISKTAKNKSQIRKSIFEYVNKKKRLDELTSEKDAKVIEFKESIRKYNQNNVTKLKDDLNRIKNQLDNLSLNDQLSNHKSSDEQSKDIAKRIKQLKDKKMKDQLNNLSKQYDRLIMIHENQLNSFVESTSKNDLNSLTNSTTDPTIDQSTTKQNLRKNNKRK